MAVIEADATQAAANRLRAGAEAAEFLKTLHAITPDIAARAAALDAQGDFPTLDFQALAAIGALRAPFPHRLGGLGLGTYPAMAQNTAALLHALGAAHVAVGRLYEAHVNAVRLICLYGNDTQRCRAAQDAADGHLIGLWVTDAPDNPLRLAEDGRLAGGKAFCSGAGHVRHVLVTATSAAGDARLLYLEADPARAARLPSALEGVRCATTGKADFTGAAISADDMIGQPGDYLREPAFSAGAWRTSAVTAGCLHGLVNHMIDALAGRGRAGAPMQQARIGRAVIARDTAALWLARVAAIAEYPSAEAPLGLSEGLAPDARRGGDPDVAAILAEVGFARIAIETCCVEVLNLTERAIGLQAYLRGGAIERLRRDLSTYLRQPALDEVLAQAADYAVSQRAAAA